MKREEHHPRRRQKTDSGRPPAKTRKRPAVRTARRPGDGCFSAPRKRGRNHDENGTVRMGKMKRLTVVLLILVLCAAAAASDAEAVVGRDIGPEDIAEFVYTLDASVYPPVYLRYRLYREEGKAFLYHEARQGDGWPQTEEDIVASGTVELTGDDLAALFDCLRGGKVTARETADADGDEGPWTYLYRTGDQRGIQEFSFANAAKRAAFEELCSRLAQNHILTRFRFIRGGYTAPRIYEITLRGGAYYLSENEGAPAPFGPDAAGELQRVIADCGAESWDGFHRSNPNMLDGEGFSLEMRYADGTNVYASGDNSFPDRYGDFTDGVDAVIEKEKKTRLAGTYRYAGGGFGGDFDITLYADGTYSFSEGPLSSYLGGGTWDVYYNAVYLTEESEPGMEFMFGAEDNALIYLEAGSDAFPHVKVSDGERFERLRSE